MNQLLLTFTFVVLLILPKLSFADSNSNLAYCEPFKDQIISLLEENEVSSEYFYLAVCESRCKIKESSKGARGFFQVTYPIYIKFKPDDCTNNDIDDIRCNTVAAANYIKHLQKRFHKMSYLIKAYNRGGHNLMRYGSTKEADGLSKCVMDYVQHTKI